MVQVSGWIRPLTCLPGNTSHAMAVTVSPCSPWLVRALHRSHHCPSRVKLLDVSIPSISHPVPSFSSTGSHARGLAATGMRTV